MAEYSRYREKALEEYNKQTKLTEALDIVTPKAWIMLFILLIIILSFIIWLFSGTVSTQVQGRAIIFSKDTRIIASMSPEQGGYVSQVYVKPGDFVKKGAIIASLNQPALMSEIQNLKAYIEEEQSRLQALEREAEQAIGAKLEQIKASLANLEEKLNTLGVKQQHLETFLSTQKNDPAHASDSSARVSETQVDFYNVKNEIQDLKIKIIDLKQEKLEYEALWQEKIRKVQARIRKSGYELNLLQSKEKLGKTIRAPAAGIVSSVYVKMGDYLSKQTTLADIVSLSDALEVIVYISAEKGKKVRPGMEAKIYPSHLNALQYGGLIGKVTYVSDLPVSMKSLMTSLENAQLAENFFLKGPVVEAKIALIKSDKTFSGYRWTTSNGPDEKLSIGSIADVWIITKKQSPIQLLFPALNNQRNGSIGNINEP